MTTRKNFVAMAKSISKLTNKAEKQIAARTCIELFSKDNPRFDTKRFLTACGL